MTPFVQLVAALQARGVRFVVIGVTGANFYARSGNTQLATQERALLLPVDPANELAAWLACRAEGLELYSGGEPLGQPLDRELADAVVARRALVKATNGRALDVDLSLVMAGFDFETVWSEHRTFTSDGVDTPVARLSHILHSKAVAGRPKDQLFLVTYEATLSEMRDLDERRGGGGDALVEHVAKGTIASVSHRRIETRSPCDLARRAGYPPASLRRAIAPPRP